MCTHTADNTRTTTGTQPRTQHEPREVFPTLDTLTELARQQTYTIAPIACELDSHFTTPLDVLRVLQTVSHHVYLLESARQSHERGRYSFLGFNPKLTIFCENETLHIGDVELPARNPTEAIRQLLSKYKSPHLPNMPSFTGGLVGYIAFEYLRYKEPTLTAALGATNAAAPGTTATATANAAANPSMQQTSARDLDLMLFDKVIAFDNKTHKLILIVNIKLNHVEEHYRKGVFELNELIQLLNTPAPLRNEEGHVTSPITAAFTKQEFCNTVRRVQTHIQNGDIFQLVLSNQMSASFTGSLLSTYRELRRINPSPYMFYFCGTDIEVAGASPETLVELKEGVLHTYPLAGTRPRGATPQEDDARAAELLADEKECAEHNMLVDLGRNDLGRISTFGSVVVEKFHAIEKFSHVMHIGSTVRGHIQHNFDALDAIEAVMPAGTLSGAPKIRACELIGTFEKVKRGIYGGALGYIDFTGNMDMCIGIRLIYKKAGRVFVHTGAGIVADSVPEHEFNECIHKAKSSFAALGYTGEVE